MYSHHFRFLAVKLAIGLLHHAEYGRVRVRCPSAVAAAEPDSASGKLKDCLHPLGEGFLCAVNGASHKAVNREFSLVNLYHREIVGSLHHSRHCIGHPFNAVRAGKNGLDETLCGLWLHVAAFVRIAAGAFLALVRLEDHLESRVGCSVFALYLSCDGRDGLEDCGGLARRNINRCECLSRDGVPQGASLEVDELDVVLVDDAVEYPCNLPFARQSMISIPECPP